MCAYGAGSNRLAFPEERGAFIESLLLKSNGAQHRIGNGTCVRATERKPRLLLGLFHAALLNQGNRGLKRLAPVDLARPALSASRSALSGKRRA